MGQPLPLFSRYQISRQTGSGLVIPVCHLRAAWFSNIGRWAKDAGRLRSLIDINEIQLPLLARASLAAARQSR